MTNNCAICGSLRANILLSQCGHVLHDRCLFPWPCKYCPVAGCHREIVNFECLKIEAFHYNGIKYECSNLMRVFGVNRRGRWTEEEYEYALALIEAFNAGLVHLPESLKLGSFLCKMLQCCAARLSSKIRKGKKVFHSKRIQEGVAVDSCEIAHYRSVQQKLSDAEREFLNKIAVSFDPEEASVLSYHIQHSWQKGFLASTHFEISKHKFFSPSMLGLKKLKHGKLTLENPLFDCFHSVARRFLSWPLDGSAHLLFEEITSKFPNINALAVNLQSHEVVLTSSPFQNVVSQFLGKDVFYSLSDLEFMFKNHHELVDLLTNQPSNLPSATIAAGNYHRHQRSVELVLVDDDKCRCYIDIMFIGSISLSTLRFHRFPLNSCDDDYELSYDDEFVTQEDEASLVEASYNQCAMFDNHLHSGGIMRPREMLSQISLTDSMMGGTGTGTGAGAKKHRDVGKRSLENGIQSRSADVMKRLQPGALLSASNSNSNSNYSSSSISLQRACGTFLLTSDKRQIPYQVGCNLSPPSNIKSDSTICDNFNSLLLEKDGLELFTDIQSEGTSSREPIVNIVYSGGLYATWGSNKKHKSSTVLSSIANEVAPTLVSAITTVDIAPYSRIPQQPSNSPNVPISFESILQSFLRVIPFHVVEIWVPVQLTNNSTVLLYGASGALDKDLLGWSSYSRNFSFNPDVGLPGRVATARTVESQTDVAKLPMPTFLRAEMAGSLGIHAACGLPFFTGNKCDAVVVFYSRHIFEPTPSLIEYMSNICESVNIRAQIRVLKP